jgi:CO/xanthine dehydrogenase Mo-binding subunit
VAPSWCTKSGWRLILAIIESQVKSAVALGLSSALLEEVAFIDGQPQARNFDCYSILPNLMPRVHVQVIEAPRWAASANRGCQGYHPQ